MGCGESCAAAGARRGKKRSSISTMSDRVRITARSIRFCSSRTLPGPRVPGQASHGPVSQLQMRTFQKIAVHVYFCDSQSPWQRGTNENTNRLLRQYFPHGADLSCYSQADLNKIALRLNQPAKDVGISHAGGYPGRCCNHRLNSPPRPLFWS